MPNLTTMTTKELDRCYICNRNLKEIESLLKLDKANEELTRVNAKLSDKIQKVSDHIKMILEKTKTYDQTLLIHELYKDNQVYTKFMPDWELLMKHMSDEIIHDAQIPSAYFRERTRQYSIKDVRKILSDAVIELDNGNWPEKISKDEEMIDLLAQKKVFSSLAKRPPLETHRHEFKFEARAEKGSYSEPTVRYVLEFVLCPVCENLLSVYQSAVIADYDDGE